MEPKLLIEKRDALLKRFETMIQKVRLDHQEKMVMTTGHSFLHALFVAQYCLMIAPDHLQIAGWIAGMLHNTDRLFVGENDDQIAERIIAYLSLTDLPGNEKNMILEAVMDHSHKSCSSENQLTTILMDADKLANLEPLTAAIRAAQWRTGCSAINLVYLDKYPPGCNYKNPGSIVRDMCSALEWEEPGWLQTVKAIELAKPMFSLLKSMVQATIKNHKQAGLIPYPFPEDFEIN